MIIDSSAVVAITLHEPSFDRLISLLREAASIGVGPATLVETGIVLQERLGPPAVETLERFILRFGVVVVPLAEMHWPSALDAWNRFGRGRHPARLNFGDCLAYATARLAGEPLLCTGNDFPRTDLELA